MKIVVWNDFCVPHCYTGETLLFRAIRELGMENRITVNLRAFELDPTFPEGQVIDVPECVAKKYGCSLPEALQKIEYAASLGRQAGIDMKFQTAVFCNTRNAHRLLKYAEHTYGNEMALKLNFALFDAYFTKNLVLDVKTLVKISSSMGMDAGTVKQMLETDEYAAEVIADEQDAARKGIFSIPRFEFDGKFAVNGSIGLDGFKDAIREMTANSGKGNQNDENNI